MLRYCDGVVSVLFPRVSLRYPLYNPCTSLIYPLYMLCNPMGLPVPYTSTQDRPVAWPRVGTIDWTVQVLKAHEKSAGTPMPCHPLAPGYSNPARRSHPMPAFCGSYYFGGVAGAGDGVMGTGRFVASAGGVTRLSPFVPGTTAG